MHREKAKILYILSIHVDFLLEALDQPPVGADRGLLGFYAGEDGALHLTAFINRLSCVENPQLPA